MKKAVLSVRPITADQRKIFTCLGERYRIVRIEAKDVSEADEKTGRTTPLIVEGTARFHIDETNHGSNGISDSSLVIGNTVIIPDPKHKGGCIINGSDFTHLEINGCRLWVFEKSLTS